MNKIDRNLQCGESQYGRLLTSTFLWEVVVGALIMGATLTIINIFGLSDTNKICTIIAVSTTYVAATFAHGFQAINSQIHGSSEFVLNGLSNSFSASRDS
jgi:hypothetical protein